MSDSHMRSLLRRVSKLEEWKRKSSSAPSLGRSAIVGGGVIVGDGENGAIIIRDDDDGGVIESYGSQSTKEPAKIDGTDDRLGTSAWVIESGRTDEEVESDAAKAFLAVATTGSTGVSSVLALAEHLEIGSRGGNSVVVEDGAGVVISAAASEPVIVIADTEILGNLTVNGLISWGPGDEPPVLSHILPGSGGYLSIDNEDWTVIPDTLAPDVTSQNPPARPGDAYIIDVPGFYLLSSRPMWGADSTGRRGTRIKVNGTVVAEDFVAACPFATNSLFEIIHLDDGDDVIFECWQNSGSSLDLMSGSRVALARLF